MPGKVIGKQFDLGYPGSISRSIDSIVRSGVVATGQTISFGDPVTMSATGDISLLSTGSTADKFSGIAVREVKQATNYLGDTTVQYLAGQPIDFLTRGPIMVICRAGTPTAGGKVYVRVAAATSDKPLGGFEAAADSTNTIELANVVWTTGKMNATEKVAEVTVLKRNA